MIKALLTEREASERYGYSVYWFQQRRKKKEEPMFLKKVKRVLYPVKETDEFFGLSKNIDDI